MEAANRGLDLEQELTCSICAEVLYQPLTLLDCLHTFCGSCLKEWFQFQSTSARNAPNALSAGATKTPYTCPSCRAPVRDTRHNATVTTLLGMFVAANPEKVRAEQERDAMRVKYTPGDDVLPKIEVREMSLRERRIEDADRRLMSEVRDLSLLEVGVEREDLRRGEESSSSRRVRGAGGSMDMSRDEYGSGSGRGGEEREGERRRRRDTASASGRRRTETESTDERRRRRSIERGSTTYVRQIEHQSSLRSLISSSDVDSQEMEAEILRQIREEGLLDGIDLENIDVSQEDQISERIAEAFRRRQSERARQAPERRSATSARRPKPEPEPEVDFRHTSASGPVSAETSGEDRPRTSSSSRRTHSRSTSTRPHSRSTSAVSAERPSRPPPSVSAAQAAHLEVHSGDEGRRHRRRRTEDIGARRSTTVPRPVAETEARPAAKSLTDLSSSSSSSPRPHSAHLPTARPMFLEGVRSSTDPPPHQVSESPILGQVSRPSQLSPNFSSRFENSQPAGGEMKTRANAQADIFLPTSGPLADLTSPDQSLMPAPLSKRDSTPSDRAAAISSGSRPSSSSSGAPRARSQLYPEPSLTCARCAKTHIEYELHYNCGICRNGEYNICLSCYRSGAGCLHWFGFGQFAFEKWQIKIQSGEKVEQPHMLSASRYVPPKIVPGGADGRRTLTTDDPHKRLQSGSFCANCLAWANECYWLCSICNDGDWGFCNLCVNQGRSCNHALLPLTYKPAESNIPHILPSHDQKTPASASILTGPGVMDLGNFKPLSFSTKCDICRYPIQPSQSRYHCFSCISRVPGTFPGDYDICTSCYTKLVVTSRRISADNGHNGWRRCLQGHRMIIVGFEDNHGGQRRVIVQGLVGGNGLNEQAFPNPDPSSGAELQKWTWGDGVHTKGDDTHTKLVATDVNQSAPTKFPDLVLDSKFPPDGGVGMICVAQWSWYPAPGADDELLFPKGAEVRECRNVNDDWYHGTYMGKRGLFPSPYVKVLDRV